MERIKKKKERRSITREKGCLYGEGRKNEGFWDILYKASKQAALFIDLGKDSVFEIKV